VGAGADAGDGDARTHGHDRPRERPIVAMTADLNGGAEDFDKLPTHELHDRAVHRAERHMDVKFFWSLLQMIPAAELVSGDEGEADFDIESSRGLVSDAVHSGDGKLGEALRPVFIDYLRKHPDA
jgi:hypothetical protein